MRDIIVGTRQSKLALIQANGVIDQLKKAGVKNQLIKRKFLTKGDRNVHVSLANIGSSVFIQEIEQAILQKDIDFAVHSMKDLPATTAEGLVIASIPVREDPRDAYLAKNGVRLKDLPKQAVIGTSSVRRAAQILAERPDLQTKWIRGAIDARIEQLQNGNYDAIILAVAGLNRLGFSGELITEYLPVDRFVPAVGQGALAIECREDDHELRAILARINDEDAAKAVTTERLFLDALDDSDQAPIGGYAYVEDGKITLHGTVATADGRTILSKVGQGSDPNMVAQDVAENLKSQGAMAIIQMVKEGLPHL